MCAENFNKIKGVQILILKFPFRGQGQMKLKIDNETLAQEFFEDALLLGIVAPVKDYQLPGS